MGRKAHTKAKKDNISELEESIKRLRQAALSLSEVCLELAIFAKVYNERLQQAE